MQEEIAKLARVIAIILLGLLVLFVINVTGQIVSLADRISPAFGTVVFWLLLALYAAAVGALVYQYARLPKPLRPPASKDDPEYPRYLERLKERLRSNQYVHDMPLDTEDDLNRAMKLLAKRADEVTRKTALQVFLTTAISQNGSLDGLAVLAAQSRMVLEIAKIYNQRPTLRDLVWLYGNVAFAALFARQIEDMDVGETIQPIISAISSSAVGAVPGMETAATVFVQSMLTGSANAFVTLRVGVLAKRYSGSLTAPDTDAIRKAAFAEAVQMIPGVVTQGATAVGRVIVRTLPMSAFNVVKWAGKTTVDTAGDVSKRILEGGKEMAATGADAVKKFTNRFRWRPKGKQPTQAKEEEPVAPADAEPERT